MANGPTADEIFPHVPLQSTKDVLISTCAKLNSTSIPGFFERDMIAALLNEENPPPKPSTCLPLLSGLPKTVSSIESIWVLEKCFKSVEWNNTALLVPPLTNTAGIFKSSSMCNMFPNHGL